MNQEAQNIVKQIQELENLANEMIDANNFDSEIFEKISQQIQEYQSQQKKLADEAKYLNDEQVEKLYKDNGGTESTVCVSGIEGDAVGLEGVFNNFITNNSLQSQVIFVNQDNHWMTVRLEKVNGGIIYQVADSMPENPTQNKSNRQERIDALMNYDGITKIPFKSEKQQNGYDCGIYCALNAVGMKTNLIDDVNYSNAKSTYSKYDVDTIRESFEKEKVAKQEPQQTNRLSSASTVSSLSNALPKDSNRSYSPQLKNLQSQRSSSTSSFGSNISMTSHSNELKRQPSMIPQQKSKGDLEDLVYGR